MDTQNLSAFLQVAESASFSLAAEKLHITQPAVSKRIASLEDQLGTRLFDRIGRTISLTEAGRVLLPQAKNIMQTVKATQQQLADLSGDVAGKLSLATSHHIGLHRLPPILKQFASEHPLVELDLAFLDSEKAYTEVIQGHIELAVITLAPQPDAVIYSENLWRDPLTFVVSPAHPLAKAKQLQLADLAPYAAILPNLNTYTTQIVKQLFDEAGIPLQLKMSTNYLETIKMMVSVNLGWSVLPTSLIDNELHPLRIAKVELSRQLGLIYHRNRSLSNAAHAFINALNQKIEA